MANIYNWVISQMDEKPKDGTLENVVTCVHWRRNAATTVDGKEYFADSYGAYQCISPNPDDFTAFAALTQADVEKWLEDGLPVADIDANLDASLEAKINPPIINLPLPWESAEVTPPAPDISSPTN
jgi:hypothetical protein